MSDRPTTDGGVRAELDAVYQRLLVLAEREYPAAKLSEAHAIGYMLQQVACHAITRAAVAGKDVRNTAHDLYWHGDISWKVLHSALDVEHVTDLEWSEDALVAYIGRMDTNIACAGCGEPIMARSHAHAEAVWVQDEGGRNPVYCEDCLAYDSKRVGFIYILKSGDFYKIGKTTDLTRRLAQLSPALPQPVDFLHVIPSADFHNLEKRLHARFAHKRKNGEWFALTNEDVSEILNPEV